jgi:hypothetical protein
MAIGCHRREQGRRHAAETCGLYGDAVDDRMKNLSSAVSISSPDGEAGSDEA